jgi:phospholipase C
MRTRVHLRLPLVALAGLAIATGGTVGVRGGEAPGQDTGAVTPIQHLVVIYQENVSFDHYFATYPMAANPSGEPAFAAKAETPSVNGISTPLADPNNPNLVQPFRLDRSQFETADQDHNYTDEQKAFDAGLMDMFVEKVGRGNGPPPGNVPHGQVMGYFDGNTVTALWNYAQAFAMSDNSYSTTFGPSSVGAVNLISGQTHGFTPDATSFGIAVTTNDTMIGDPQPAGDGCDTRDVSTQLATNTDKNIGDLLNAKNITWGWFQGGFREVPGFDNSGHPLTCFIVHQNMAGVFSKDYIPHHEPFQYYRSTQNLQHLPPSSTAMIGKTDQANHQYDLNDFWTAVDDHNMPAVSYLKAPAYQDGHAGYSDPLDEQTFLVNTINRLERSPDWHNTAVVIAYDDSDGWYDHAMSPIVNQSQDSTVDALNGATCGTKANNASGGYQDRCGYGPRQPLLVISPFARSNFVDHSVTDQTSILRFIEDNWQTGRIGDASFDTKAGSLMNMLTFTGNGAEGGANKLFLDPSTGERSGDQG